MGDEDKKRWCGPGAGSWAGPLWIAAWLFTIGFLKLSFWKAVVAIIIWPYYIGAFFAK